MSVLLAETKDVGGRPSPAMAHKQGTSMLQTYEGGCHCGRVHFRVQADLEQITECNCSICTKKGFLHLIMPFAQFDLQRGQDDLTTYTFGTGVAKHTFCRHCGMHSFYTPRSHPDQVSVNARCLEGIDFATLRVASLFDGQHWEQAQAARKAGDASW